MENSLINHAELAAGMVKSVLLVEWLSEIYISGNSFYYNIIKEKLSSVNTETAELDNVLLIGSENRIIVDAEGKLPIGKELAVLKADQVELRSAWEGKSDASVLFPGKDGRPHKSAYAPVFSKDGKVVAVVRVEASARFLDTVNRVAFILLVAGLIITALGAFLGFFIARSVVNPIKKLVQASENISAGNLDTEVNINSKDEIGFFAKTFNQMAKNLKKLYEEVSEHGRQIAELSASVAHEVRSPISAIQGFTELLEDELDEDDSRREYINDIREEIKILNSKVTNLIHFARPLTIDPVPLDIMEVLEIATASIDKEAVDKEVEINLNVMENLPPALGDYEQLRGLFVNLIRNSIQAVTKGGNININVCASNGTIDNKDNQKFLEITISDNGVGMTPDNLKKAFDPFHTTKADGTGLGLPICKKIVNAHNGEIKLESVFGEGTTVKVLIPSCPDQFSEL
ncbi:MAG: ATP-binding protein [Candidatus Poribacteria bacterium]